MPVLRAWATCARARLLRRRRCGHAVPGRHGAVARRPRLRCHRV